MKRSASLTIGNIITMLANTIYLNLQLTLHVLKLSHRKSNNKYGVSMGQITMKAGFNS